MRYFCILDKREIPLDESRGGGILNVDFDNER